MNTRTWLLYFYIIFPTLLLEPSMEEDDHNGCNTENGVTHCEKDLCPLRADENLLSHIKWECVNTTVKRLEISDNYLNASDINNLVTACAQHLEELDLSLNNIERFFEVETMRYFQRLKYLDISYNKKLCNWERTLAKDLFSQNFALRVVLLRGCDEEVIPNEQLANITRDMKKHLGFKHQLILKNCIIDDIEVELPENVTDIPITNEEPSVDGNNYIIEITVAVLVVIIIVIIVAVVYLRFCKKSAENPRSYRQSELQNNMNNSDSEEERLSVQPEVKPELKSEVKPMAKLNKKSLIEQQATTSRTVQNDPSGSSISEPLRHSHLESDVDESSKLIKRA